MDKMALKVPKRSKQVKVWVHPAGPVIGTIFLNNQSTIHEGEEEPIEVLNHPAPFLVMKCGENEEVRFYSKNSIVRVEHSGKAPSPDGALVTLPTRLYMMDGSVLNGFIRESLPPEHSRLFDYLNIVKDRFVRVYAHGNEVLLVNKAYIARVSPVESKVAHATASNTHNLNQESVGLRRS